MSNVAKLKKKAAELEQKKQFDKALAVYVQILQAGPGKGEVDVALYNRVGDLYMREGKTNEALGYYESAVDLYADGGFFNNAIALCNKILRQAPGRTVIYYKLGKISAQKGFKSDAKANFLEYASRMQKAGQLDEAFRALREFADLSPDQDDIRVMLADQLTKSDRKDQALEQLQLLYDKYAAEGRTDELKATMTRMQALNAPGTAARTAPSSTTPLRAKAQDLVFLDLDSDGAADDAPAAPAAPPPRPAAPVSPTPRSADLPFLDLNEAPPPAVQAPTLVPPPLAPAPLPMPPDVGAANESVLGFERTSFDAEALAGSDGAAGGFASNEFAPPTLSADDFSLGSGDSFGDDRSTLLPAHDLVLPGELPPVSALASAPPAHDGLDLVMPTEFDGSGFDLSNTGASSFDTGATGSSTTPYQGFDSIEFETPALDVGPSPTDALPMIELDAFAGTPSPTSPTPHGVPATEAPAEWTIEPLVQPAIAPARPAAPPPPPPPALPVSPIEALRARAEAAQGDWDLRRQLGEALFEAGDREGGLYELELAMVGYERANDLDGAAAVVDEIVRVQPSSVRHHQKRVEYAVRGGDKPRLADAYLQLADVLFRTGQTEMSRTVYHRVLELVPDDARARAALTAFLGEPAVPAPSAPPPSAPTPAAPAAPAAQAPARPAPVANSAPAPGGGEFVDLGEWLRADEPVRSTRMRIDEQAPTGDEQADFNEMLKKFKAGVAENVDADDHESHYDLGVAFKEMGLLDEAIAEFQKALRAPARRARTYEALGQCFMEQQQLPVALTILQRALGEPGVGDDQLVGVLYLLGYASEALQRHDDAVGYYQRVFAVDIQFRDVGERLNALEKVPR